MICRSFLVTTTLWLALAGLAAALPPPAPEGDDPFAELLFPPDLVLRNQGRIGLSPAQREDLVLELTDAQAAFVPLQAELAESGERLQSLLAGPRIDELEAIATARAMMELESRIKQRHLELAIRIKNLLSEDQQRRLSGMR